jgi:hypothetical protein
MIVSFKDYELIPRYDDTQWIELKIYESTSESGPWTPIDTQSLDPVTDPSDPQPVSFTTDKATLADGQGWYKVAFIDAAGNAEDTEPIFNPATTEILASLDDVNAHLDGEVIEADANNSNLVQISVARIVRGYLAAVVDAPTLMSWQTPETTPDMPREIASMLIAAQVYFNLAARQSLDLSNDNFAQRLYTEAMAMLQGIVDGTIPLGGIDGGIITTGADMGDQDYFPIDSTDRAFTVGMIL